MNDDILSLLGGLLIFAIMGALVLILIIKTRR